MTKFSVIIPLYNKETYIKRAIESVLTQSHKPHEIIVVDDGSTDKSVQVIERLSIQGITVVRQGNMGGAGGQARNTGMKIATGDWFAFLDADDEWLSDHLLELQKVSSHISKPALISTTPIELPEGRNPTEHQNYADQISQINYFIEAGRKIGILNCSSCAIHRSIYEEIGGFSRFDSGPDLEYWVRIACSFPVVISQSRTSVYRRGNFGNMELIESKNKTCSESTPDSLSDVAPSLATLSKVYKINAGKTPPYDISEYIDGRLIAGIKINIRKSNPAYARKLKSFLITRRFRSFRISLLLAACYFPKKLLLLLNKLYSIARFIISRGSGGNV